MVARKLLTVIAVGLSAGALAGPAATASAEAERVQKAAAGEIVDAQLFRHEIEGYVRELNRQMRVKLNEDLRRELAPKAVLAVNELRAKS